MRTILTSFIFFLCLVPITGQTNDTIRQEILDQSSSKVEILSKGRKLLLDNLEKGDLFKVMEIKNELIREVDSKPNEVFFSGEYKLILYWTEEYGDLLAYIKSDISKTDDQMAKPLLNMHATSDQLYKNISLKSAESYDVIVHFLDDAQLTDVEKDFLELHLYWMLFGPNSTKETEALTQMNDLAEDFLEKYPNSEFEQFTRNNIRYKLELNNWGIGYEVGMGYIGTQGGLATQFKDGFIIRTAVDASYKKMILSLNINVGATSTKVDFPYRETQWPKGSAAMMTDIDLSIGYRVLEVKKLSFIPFVGFGAINLSPGAQEIDEDYSLAKLNYTAQNYLAGMNCTFDLGDKDNPFYSGGNFLNLRYTFVKPQYNGRKGIESGNMHWVTLGWGIYARPVKRMF